MTPTQRPSVERALALIWQAAAPLGVETISCSHAAGRTTAQGIQAMRDTPTFRASAMDGFALCSGDTTAASHKAPVRLRLLSPVFAGMPVQPLARGAAIPISTGAPVPEGADAVLVREAAEIRAGELVLDRPVLQDRNVRQIGEDARAGDMILPPGAWLSPAMIGALTAYGVARLPVWRSPGVAVISTGSELMGSGAVLERAAFVDSNGPMIRSAVGQLGLGADFIGIARDERHALDAALDAASASDLVVSTGGVSAGDLDLVRERLEARGAEIIFHGVRMRPGKPLLFARLADGRLYFGLPGTPVAALVTFRFFVTHAIRRLAGLPAEQGEPIRHNGVAREGTTLFLRARRGTSPQGHPLADTQLDQRPHILRSIFEADLWLRLHDGDGEGDESSLAYPFTARL
ncbi:MAG: molybdopterin molybdotransferase MoeA [Caulobacter sp.]|nr:molybdopterin molybdotransferase MoeA [Caulobacter sp.]